MGEGPHPGGRDRCQQETDGTCPEGGELATELEAARKRLRIAEEKVRVQGKEIERLTTLTVQLEEALASRPTIDQAKGVIIDQTGCSPDDAFRRLVALSRNRNVKVREVARAVVDQAQRAKWLDR